MTPPFGMNQPGLSSKKMHTPRPWSVDPLLMEPWMIHRLGYLQNHGDPAKRALYAKEKREMEREARRLFKRRGTA